MKKFMVFLAGLAAFGMVFGFTVTAALADADLYGSVRFRTYWVDKDEGYGGGGYSTNPGIKYDDEDLDWRIGYLSRWGVNYQSGDIRANVELDTRDIEKFNSGKNGSAELGDVRVRHMWGEWDFGMGKLMIGQNFNPCTVYDSQIGYYSGSLQPFHGTGLKYFRTSQIRLTFDNFMVAFLTPDSEQNYGQADTDETLPRIEMRYSMKLDPVTLDFMGGWQQYEVVDLNDSDEEITSYFLGLYAQANFGPAYVKGLVNYRQNGGNYGLWSATLVNENAQWNGDDFDDSEAWGYSIVLGYKFTDKITVEANWAGSMAENDDMSGSPEDDVNAYALLLKYEPAPGVVIQPELIYDDREESDFITGGDDDQGDALIAGIFWIINFK